MPKKSKKNTKQKQSKKPKAGKKVKKTAREKKLDLYEADEYAEHAADKKKAAKSKPQEIVIMDRDALKTIAAQLKEAGSDIKVLKSDSDADLQKKVNAELQKLPSAEVLKKLENIEPEKLVTVLKRDCFGIFIDLSDVSCLRCKDNKTCATQFIKNLKGGMTIVHGAETAEAEEKKPEKAKLAPVTRYNAERLVFVRDVKNPNPKGDDYHDTIQAVLDEQPDTMESLREIVERDFDIDSDGDFMKFVTSMRDPVEGIIKLDVDLTEDHKKQLRKAGVEI